MERFYLALDCEGGGPGAPFSLTEIYLGIFDANFKKVDELNLKVAPDNGQFVVSVEGLSVSNTDLRKWNDAISYREAGTQIYNFLKRNHRGSFYTPIGNGAGKDVKWITDLKIISDNSWQNYVSVNPIELSSVVNFLKDSGKIPLNINTSLGELSKYLGLGLTHKHTAKDDSLLGIEIYKALLNL